MNICFLGNFYKTQLYCEIRDEIVRRNPSHRIFWILCDENQKRMIGADQYLIIDFSLLSKDEDEIGNFKLNELIYGDRYLRYNIERGVRYLTNIQKPIYQFLKENQISYVFGERTWAHELLIGRIINAFNELSCQYLSLSTVRIPYDRFSFFKDEKEIEILEIDTLENQFDFNLKKPDYLEINEKILKKKETLAARINRVKRFLTSENISKKNPTNLSNFFLRFKIGSKEEINRILYRFVKTCSIEDLKGKKYVFFGLHKQPESSIDIRGRYFEDQYKIVVNLWRNLPNNWFLVVKEHSNAVGDRSLSFFHKIKKYPNILIIDEKEDSHLIMKESKLVVSVSGTICYEAALLRIPSITLSKTFFNKLNYSLHRNWVDLDEDEGIDRLIMKNIYDNSREFKKYIMTNSFYGIVTDPNSDPNVLNHKNIKSIADAFEQILRI